MFVSLSAKLFINAQSTAIQWFTNFAMMHTIKSLNCTSDPLSPKKEYISKDHIHNQNFPYFAMLIPNITSPYAHLL